MPQSQVDKVKVNEVEVDFIALKFFIDQKWHDVEARQLKLLKLLIENYGQAVSRNQIMDVLWQDTIVSDNSVSQAITQLRKSLHDDKETPRFIKTVPRVGYQLIAELVFPEPASDNVGQFKKNKFNLSLVAIASVLLGIGITFSLFELSKPSLQVPEYTYESRLTSTPGPENFLRYSPKGRYLAFSQSSNNRDQMDMAVFDAQTQAVHVIKSTGYSEEAPEWSPDGKWLIYYRHDPISCEIRVMSVVNPIETWRLSPDFHLSDCQVGFSRQKMHWLNDNTLYLQRWQNNLPILTKLTLATEGYPSLIKQDDISNIQPILMDIDKETNQLLFVEQSSQGYVLQHMDLVSSTRSVIEIREQEYWGIKWHESGESFWLGNESLRLMSLDGNSEVVHLPIGFIPDIDLNPLTKQLAHAEGLVNVNLYNLQLKSLNNHQQVVIKQLSSSARTDVLPTLSKDGRQTAFVSYQRRSTDGLKHVEIWLKYKDKKAANLLANLPEDIHPKYLLWSPNGENLLLGDSRQNLHLINIYSKHLVAIIYDYNNIDEVNWSSDGRFIVFSATNDDSKQLWQYDLQLASTKLLNENKLHVSSVNDSQQENNVRKVAINDVLSVENMKKLNPSYHHYISYIETFLSAHATDQLPVDNLAPSLLLYRPHVFDLGIYYVVKQGHQLGLYLFKFAEQDHVHIANIGRYEQDINLMLNISASNDGKHLVFSKVEGFETDILLQRKSKD
ncbi:MAG: winged helix-turn-helix domain-containing protein [Colwellia sp.]|uniref:winged helix-turn-helix domain-containing protein n=1 Tax=Colwellia sp. TaxID=56799 RepID=UPI001D814996|nr:winged helix-turn-helix domain-containing protein [Colwellia sp.]NQY48421.1 winged helix-turn-helix domain-containing protein [Colwellia sp.]